MSETDRSRHERRLDSSRPEDRRDPAVLYVARSGSEAVPQTLQSEYGIVVTAVSSPETAFERLTDAGEQFDCVVVDDTAEDANELSVVRRIRAQCPDIPFIVYAAPDCDQGLCEEYLQAGAEDVVVSGPPLARTPLLANRIVRCTTYEREFEAIKEKYESLIDAAPDAIFVADADTGEIVEANDTAAEILGCPREAIIGMDQTELHPPEDHERYRDLFEAHLRSDGGILNQFDDGGPIYVVTADGERIPVEINATVIAIEGQTLVQGHFRDISGRKQRERDYRSFREAVEQAGHAIMITDPAGTIEYVNPRFEELSGYSAVEVLGENPSILSSGEHDGEFYRDLWETITAGEVWEGEIVNQRKNGERYHIDQTIAPITDERGTIERFVAINTDITEQKRREAQLQRERDRLREFAGTVAHDLRNPLTIAMGHVQIARKQTTSSDGLVEPLETAMTALERMETVVDEVLTLSERGETIREPTSVRLADVARRTWDLTDTASATLSVDDDLAEWTVQADESRLCQLFENLFQNAAEYAGPNPTVCIGRLPEGDGFYVEDDGNGLPPNDRNRVFESGYTTNDDGTGFGLAIVKQIAEAHGWEIRATDAKTDAGGARFEITGVRCGSDRPE
jgi:PAS domain S-box-containing protein